MSGHRSSAYLNTLLIPTLAPLKPKERPAAVRARVLTGAEATSLEQALYEDAREYYFSAALSFVEALRGPQQEFYTWATVKLYYSVFYALRSILALHGWCVFYVEGSCYYLKAIPGETATSGEQSTHKSVLKCFGKSLHHLGLLTPIGLRQELAPNWLMRLREEANYKNGRFYEPDPPPHFRKASQLGARKLIAMYLEPKNYFLAFDEEHAIISFPLAALRCAAQEFSRLHLDPLAEEDVATLQHHCIDKSGPLDKLLSALKG